MKKDKFDIAVIGAGAAGVAAACSASMKGNSVLLVDLNRRVGGMATNAEVGTICGLYRYNSDGFQINVGEFAVNFANQIQQSLNQAPIDNDAGLKYLPFSINDFESLCEKLIEENNIEYWSGSKFSELTTEGNRIKKILINKMNDVIDVEVDAVVDTSGVGVVSECAGTIMRHPEFDQAISQVFTVSGFQFQNETQPFFIFNRAIQRGVMDGDLPKGDYQVYVVPGSIRDDCISLKLNLAENEFNLPVPATEVIESIISYLQNSDDAFENAKLVSIASQPGLRIGNRPVGKYVLSTKDVVNCKKSTRSVARGNWPQEIWKANKRVKIVPLQDSYYDIPANCLVSSDIENLFFGGRCISADDGAIASARVIGTCLQTGYAAGYLASDQLLGTSFDDSIDSIRKEQFKL